VRNDDKPTANPFVVLREEFDDSLQLKLVTGLLRQRLKGNL